ncbi:MAG TPA: thermonuclease family protein [Desulfuromonadales bacterium]|nr:thermonuclease family protein [Desulfuromonadales bacterium]
MAGFRLLSRLAIVFAFLLLPVFQQTATAEPAELAGKVIRIYDGDTIEVESVGKVRLIGIDVPEFKASQRDRFYQRQNISPDTLRRTARRARMFNIDHARGERVRLSLDHQFRDRYDRVLAYVHLPDGQLLNRLLLEAGLASVYRRFKFRLKDDFLNAEAEARRHGVGMWQKQ